MAVFGVPVAHEDDPARALRAALGIRKRLVELNRQLRADGRPELQVRIGINSGDVVSTTTPRRGEVMVTGDAVNVAARVQQLAEPGRFSWASARSPPRRRSATGPSARTASAARRWTSRSASSSARRSASGRGTNLLRAPLVGREEELALLTSLVDRVAADRRPHLVTLYGQPGVGKSRLTAEFLATLARRPVPPRVVRGRCLSYGSGVTFWPLAEILKSEAEILDSDPPDEAVRKLEAMRDRLISAELATEPSRTTALLGFTVGIAVPGHDFSRMDPEQLRIGVSEAWRIFFSALAERGPGGGGDQGYPLGGDGPARHPRRSRRPVQGSVLFLCPAAPISSTAVPAGVAAARASRPSFSTRWSRRTPAAWSPCCSRSRPSPPTASTTVSSSAPAAIPWSPRRSCATWSTAVAPSEHVGRRADARTSLSLPSRSPTRCRR